VRAFDQKARAGSLFIKPSHAFFGWFETSQCLLTNSCGDPRVWTRQADALGDFIHSLCQLRSTSFIAKKMYCERLNDTVVCGGVYQPWLNAHLL